MNSFKSRAKKPTPYKSKTKQLTPSTTNPGLMLASPLSSSSSSSSSSYKTIPTLSSFISTRDYLGAITLLEFELAHRLQWTPVQLECARAWLAFCAYHLGDYHKALAIYRELAEKARMPLPQQEDEDEDEEEEVKDEEDEDAASRSKEKERRNQSKRAEREADKLYKRPSAEQWQLYASCCLFYLGQYKEAQELVQSVPSLLSSSSSSPALASLSTRLLFHCSHKLNEEAALMKYHGQMSEAREDQLSLASIHFLRNHFQEATDIYKKLLLVDRDFLALQVYVAMCYYKLDYYDVSLEILTPYLAHFPDSYTAINLKACNHFKLYEGKAAEAECKNIVESLQALSPNGTIENDLIRHNLVVFRSGEQALTVLPPLINVIPEARLNLCIYHLKHHEIDEAEALMKDLEPTAPQEYILKGVVASAIGQLTDSKSQLKAAQEYFQLVGASASECDTIPGRQCMASCFFLLKQFDDVLIYLNSIKAYSAADSTFYFNHGVALSATEQFSEAIEAFEAVTDPSTKSSYTYLSWLARCYCMVNSPRAAWELYLKMESNADSYSMLVLIANDCYKIGSFFYAMKAYDVLERLDPSPEHWEGKRGAAVGVLQAVLAKKEKKESLKDVLNMLKSNAANAHAEQIVRVIRKYCVENGVNIV